MNRTGTTQKRIEQVDGRTVLFLTVCSCLVSFLTTDLIGHAVFTFWLLLILCYFGLLVMEHGQLIEQGTHDTLMERQGKYTQMWNSYMESISWKIRAGKGGAIE